MPSEKVKLAKLWECVILGDGLATMAILSDLTPEQRGKALAAAAFLQTEARVLVTRFGLDMEVHDETP